MKKVQTNRTTILVRMVMLSMMVAIGVVISPILRVEGMCPMAHFINVVCAVLLGPWGALLCAVLIGVIRMALMNIPPLALTGAVFGAFLSGWFYKMSKGRMIYAVLGEVVGTGIIGAIVSYPVMTLIMGRTGLTWFFYVPGFTTATLIGGSIAMVFLKALCRNKTLVKFQKELGQTVFEQSDNSQKDSVVIGVFGLIILFLGIFVTKKILHFEGPVSLAIPFGAFLLFEFIAALNLKYALKEKKAK